MPTWHLVCHQGSFLPCDTRAKVTQDNDMREAGQMSEGGWEFLVLFCNFSVNLHFKIHFIVKIFKHTDTHVGV